MLARRFAAGPVGRRLTQHPLLRSFSTAPAQPPPQTRVQASLRLYRQHVLVASRARLAAEWPKRVEGSAAPLAEQDDEDRALAAAKDGSVALAQMAQAAQGSDAPILTLVDVSDPANAAFNEGDLLLFSEKEVPLLLSNKDKNSNFASGVQSWKPKSAAPASHATQFEVKNLAGALPDHGAQHALLQLALKLRGATAIASEPSTLTPNSSRSATGELCAAEQTQVHVLALVCCHAQRDARCGDRGPPLVKAISRWGESIARGGGVDRGDGTKLGVAVHALPCSHVGGHEFAGNVILYGWTPASRGADNDWFGMVAPALVPQLMESYTRFLHQAGSIQDGEDKQAKLRELRAQLLQQKLQPVPHEAGPTCASCDKPADSSAAPFVPARLAQLWRGAMGVEKAEARALLGSLRKE